MLIKFWCSTRLWELSRTALAFLLRPQDRRRSIVMSTSDGLSVCPTGYLRNHTRDLYQFFVHVAYGRGSVFLRQGDEIPRRRDNLGFFLPIDNAL